MREDTLLLGGAWVQPQLPQPGEEQYLSIFPTVKLKGYDLQSDPDRNSDAIVMALCIDIIQYWLHIYIYIYMNVCMYVCMYICIIDTKGVLFMLSKWAKLHEPVPHQHT